MSSRSSNGAPEFPVLGEQLERAHLGDLAGQVERDVLAGPMHVPVAAQTELTQAADSDPFGDSENRRSYLRSNQHCQLQLLAAGDVTGQGVVGEVSWLSTARRARIGQRALGTRVVTSPGLRRPVRNLGNTG